MAPTKIVEEDSPIGAMCSNVFGEAWASFRIDHLSAGDSIDVELYQFINQENPQDNVEYWKTAFPLQCSRSKS